jgi:protein AATF/BFR2
VSYILTLYRKSKLRKPEVVSLGPQYSGSRVSRNALNESDSDDPFAQHYEDEDGEEEAGIIDSAEPSSENDEVSDDEDLSAHEFGDDVETSGTDFSDEDDSAGEDNELPKSRAREHDGIDRAEMRKLMMNDQKSVAAAISHGAKADVDKGRAVKTQRTIFDTLLNTRIKMQKALVSVNSLAAAEAHTEDTIDVISSAESAAIKLWNNLNSLRSGLESARTGKKRKHSDITTDTPLSNVWKGTKAYESEQIPHRNSSLNFWSAKCRATTALPQARGRLSQSSTQQNLTDVLAAQMADMPRLLARTRIPRSCAPIQAAAAAKNPGATTSAVTSGDDSSSELPIYDDADFYSTLLQSLISQRSSETTTSMGNLNLNLQPWQAAREARTKKVVDTKASKGRKLRYTVHEKLQNFMASENRGEWGDRQADELFGSLFGRRVELVEAGDADMDDELDLEGEGLRLFAGV